MRCLLAGCFVVGMLTALPLRAVTPIENLPAPIYWRQAAFSIPFNLAAPEAGERQPAEVRLYVCTDNGKTWTLAQQVPPAARSFVFRAPGDGEYWFLIRTADSQGRVIPEPRGTPELRVVIDSAAPKLELTAERGDAGQVKATWAAVDPILNADSLQVEYQTTNGTWLPVAVDRPRAGVDRANTSGTLTWWPTDASATVAIRAEVTDRAGNRSTTQATASTRTNVAANPTPVREPAPPRTNATAPNSPLDIPPPPGETRPTPWPADNNSRAPLGRNASNTTRLPATPLDEPPPNFGGRPDWSNRDFTDPPPSGLIASEVNPPIRDEVRGEPVRREETSENDASVPKLPPGERPRLVGSRSFEMDYEIDAIGPAGIAKVELWGTRDGGRTWTSYGVDADNRSPIRVNVEGEGLYGFRIAVQSGNGLGGLPPRGGDLPEVWISIDLTKPTARLLGAEVGTDDRAGELSIRWEAADAALAARPVTILFSDRPGGPWSIIAAGLANTGQYSWRPDNRAPDRIYLRLEVRDEAGNTAVFEAADPVALARVRPEGRIRGVRPLEGPTTGARQFQFYR